MRSFKPAFVVIVPLSAAGCFGVSYGPRIRTVQPDGSAECTVRIVNNPPRVRRVPCDVPLTPPADGSDYCSLEWLDPDYKNFDPSPGRTWVDCDSD